MDQLARLDALEAENERLRDRNAQLEDMLGLTIEMPVFLGLTVTEGRVFGALLKRPACTKDHLMHALYSLRHDGEEPEMKILDVLVCKLRKKLSPLGITIETIWGQGYLMTPDMQARSLAMIEQRSIA